jgi:probable rRNA maturation factor
MSVETDVVLSSPAWEGVAELESLTQRVVRQAAHLSGVSLAGACELCVSYCDDAAIRALNAQWRGQDKPTNVLSFPTPGALSTKPMLGDIVVAYETVVHEAREQAKDLHEYISYMIVHGFLHLIGYDHETAAEAELMEGLERRIARSLGLSDPYEGTPPLGDDDFDIDGPHKEHVNEP